MAHGRRKIFILFIILIVLSATTCISIYTAKDQASMSVDKDEGQELDLDVGIGTKKKDTIK